MAEAMPSAVRALSTEARAVLKRACNGDWRRVTFSGNVAVVHNQPQTSVRPATKTYRTLDLVEERRKAPKKEEEERREPLIPQPTRWPSETPRITGPVPEKAPEAKRVVLRGIPEGFDPFAKMDAEEVLTSAYALQRHVQRGLGDVVPLTIYEEVLATTGLDLEDAEAVVRRADRSEVRPESAIKGYPIVKFSRGDVDVIVGFRTPSMPSIIRVDQGARLQHDMHRVDRHGGGGAKKSNGLPWRPDKIREGLIRLGCSVPELDGKPVEVSYKGQSLGKLSPVATSKEEGQSTWQRFYRKWDAINRSVKT